MTRSALFAQLERCVRPGGRRGSQQHQLPCTSQLFPPGSPRPLFDMPSSAHGSKHDFSCEKSLCTQDKRLNRQRVCAIPFCSYEPSGREPPKHAQKRTCCGTHCTHESCSTLLQPSSSLQRCHPVPCTDFTVCAHRPLSLITRTWLVMNNDDALRCAAAFAHHDDCGALLLLQLMMMYDDVLLLLLLISLCHTPSSSTIIVNMRNLIERATWT